MTAINNNVNPAVSNDATTNDTDSKHNRLRLTAIVLLIAVLGLVVFFRSLGSPGLLDEQFILDWLKALNHGGSDAASQRQFFAWGGLNPADAGGFLSNVYLRAASFFAGGHLFVMRLFSLWIHIAGACCVGLIAYRLSRQTLAAAVAAVLFLVAPLSVQPVCWLGGNGSLLSGALVLVSLFCYLVGRYRGFNWLWLGISAAGYVMALLTSANAAYAPVVFILCELLVLNPRYSDHTASANPHDNSVDSFSNAVMAPLIFVIITAAYLAGTGLIQTLIAAGTGPELSPGNLFQGMKKCLLPVNDQLYTNSSKQMFWLGVFTAPAGLGLAIALMRKATPPSYLLFCFLWFIAALLPNLGHLPTNKSWIGDGAFYQAIAPLAVLLAIGFSGWRLLIDILPLKANEQTESRRSPLSHLGTAVVAILALLLTFQYCKVLWKEHDYLRASAKNLAKLQKDGKQSSRDANAPYVVITTMPKTVALSPLYNTIGVALFDGSSMLMSSPTIPGGRLKEALRRHEYVKNSGRWQEAMKTLVPLDLHFDHNFFGLKKSAAELGNIAIPNIIHNAQARYDEAETAIVLTSKAPAGPILTLDGAGLSPLDGDFLYIDAKLTGIAPGAPANIEVYWQTREMDFYDNVQRKVSIKADPQAAGFVRYYVPLRTIGWTTNGPLIKVTLGFPAGSTASIREMGILGSEGLLPQLSFEPPAAPDAASLRFANGYYNFPTLPDLGLCALPSRNQKLTLTYDASRIQGARGVTFEVSLPNKQFDQPNSTRLSGVTWKRLPVESVSGNYELSLEDMQTPGIVSVRAIAMDEKHAFLGFFSDDICINVRR